VTWRKYDTIVLLSIGCSRFSCSMRCSCFAAHWAQKILLFQSAMQHFHSFPTHDSRLQLHSYNPTNLVPSVSAYSGSFAPLSGMVLHDMDLPMSEHETGVFNISLDSVLAHSHHPGLAAYKAGVHLPDSPFQQSNMVFAAELDAALARATEFWTLDSERIKERDRNKNRPPIEGSLVPTMPAPQPAHMLCYERVTFTRAFGIFATSALDTVAFREAAYRTHSIQTLAHRCPPRRVVMVYRENRGILNWEAIGALVLELTGKPMARETINGESTSRRQVELFASAGMLLSSHSSQLVNVMFSHPLSTMIEVTAEFFNADFSEYAHGMGVHFQYALGGQVQNGIQDPGQWKQPFETPCIYALDSDRAPHRLFCAFWCARDLISSQASNRALMC
jgi:hypothetical protein